MKHIKEINLGLDGYNDLFTTEEERQDKKRPRVYEIPLTELIPFQNHPFKVKDGEEMEQLKESIRESGVLVPALARPTEDGYELISGHRRAAACAALGIESMPVIVRELTDEEAIITMVDSNLHREHILPSEKAFAYKMKMEALHHQGKASRQLGEKWSVGQLSQSGNDSERQVHRYIRLTNLLPDILAMVDEGKIALTPAVELSYLKAAEQEALLSTMIYDEKTPSLSQAQRLRSLSNSQTLTEDSILEVMSEVKGNQKEYVKVPMDSLREYFKPDTSVKQMTETLVEAMDFYKRHMDRRRTERDTR